MMRNAHSLMRIFALSLLLFGGLLIHLLLTGGIGQEQPGETGTPARSLTDGEPQPVSRIAVAPEIPTTEEHPSRLSVALFDAATSERIDKATVRLRDDGAREILATETQNGVYRFAVPVAPGEYELKVTAEGFLVLREPLSLAGTGEKITVELVPAGTLSVTVVDRFRNAVSDARVTLHAPAWARTMRVWSAQRSAPRIMRATRHAFTDEDGLAVFLDVPPGVGYRLTARADGSYPVEEQGLFVPAGEEADTELVLKPGGRVYGTIVDAHGLPGSDFLVECFHRTRMGERFSTETLETSILSEADGYFEVRGLRPGWKWIRFRRASVGRMTTFSLELNIGEGVEHDCGVIGPAIPEDGGVPLFGRVVDQSGDPVGDAYVRVITDGLDPINARMRADGEGVFRVDGLPGGMLRLLVYPSERDRDVLRTVELKVDLEEDTAQEVIVVLPPTEERWVLGFRVMSTDGSAYTYQFLEASDVGIFLEAPDGTWVSPNYGLGEQDGKAVLTAKVPAVAREYDALLVGNGLVARERRIVVEEDRTDFIEIVAEDAPTIRGRLIDKATGEPLVGSVTRLMVSGNQEFRLNPVLTDEQGRFAMTHFGLGETGQMRCQARRYRGVTLSVVGLDHDLGDIPLERGR